MNREIYFEAVCPENYEDIYDFQKFGIWHNTAFVVMYICTLIFEVMAGIACVLMGKWEDLLTGVILFTVMTAFPFICARAAAKKTMHSPIHVNNVNRFLFYQDGFVNTDNFSRADIYYGQLVKAYETEKYFYLYIEDQRAFVINKKCFVYNTPQEMRRLLQIKLGGRFYIKLKT